MPDFKKIYRLTLEVEGALRLVEARDSADAKELLADKFAQLYDCVNEILIPDQNDQNISDDAPALSGVNIPEPSASDSPADADNASDGTTDITPDEAKDAIAEIKIDAHAIDPVPHPTEIDHLNIDESPDLQSAANTDIDTDIRPAAPEAPQTSGIATTVIDTDTDSESHCASEVCSSATQIFTHEESDLQSGLPAANGIAFTQTGAVDTDQYEDDEEDEDGLITATFGSGNDIPDTQVMLDIPSEPETFVRNDQYQQVPPPVPAQPQPVNSHPHTQIYDPSESMKVDEMISRAEARDLGRAFSVNDRFTFLRELFNNDIGSFNMCVQHISELPSLGDAYDFLLNDLGWDTENPYVNDFISIVAKHFNDSTH